MSFGRPQCGASNEAGGIGAALIAGFFIAFDLPSIVFADHAAATRPMKYKLGNGDRVGSPKRESREAGG